jgi:hypothetical protein
MVFCVCVCVGCEEAAPDHLKLQPVQSARERIPCTPHLSKVTSNSTCVVGRIQIFTGLPLFWNPTGAQKNILITL